MIRISKYLSLCGVTSRRGAEALIAERRVTINNIAIEKPGTLVDQEKDVVKVDGTEVSPVDRKIYVVLNKPKMVMTTLFDPFRRRTVLHYLRKLKQRVYPVGRLDYDTEGVLLLTNDGDLAYRLSHPKYQIPRIYEAQVLGHFKKDSAEKIERGIKLDDNAVGRANVSILGFVKNTTRIRLLLREGRKREVKQLCRKVGHPVHHLRRVEFAGINSKKLQLGEWRFLTDREIDRLKQMVELKGSE